MKNDGIQIVSEPAPSGPTVIANIDDRDVCANCGRAPMETKMFCADCQAAYNIGRNLNLEERLSLKSQLGLQRRLLQHIFWEYQRLLEEKKGVL